MWMEESFSAGVSLEQMAVALNISASRLRHLFKQETGNSPSRYVKLMQLLQAKELMQHSFLSVKEVMTLVGLTDISHFVRDYKKLHGQTPGQTRKTYPEN
jgi:two-component system response regulator YesN